MEKLDKKKVLAVVLIIALIAAVVGTVSLLYNSIDMFLHNAVSSDNGPTELYKKWQRPYAIMMLFAFVVAAIGTGMGVASFLVKKASAKKVNLILSLCAAAALIILVVAAFGLNLSNEAEYAAEYADKYAEWGASADLPYGVYGNARFALYSGVMSAMLQQLVFSAIIAGVLLTVYLVDKKSAKAGKNATEANDINSENKGE